jgi:hypothetical protein
VQLLREGYHERLFLLTDESEGTIVRKQAKSPTNDTLLMEIRWLEELPAALHDFFPRVLRSNKESESGQALFYDMPYFHREWVLLSELILTQVLDPSQALRLIARVLQVMFDGIFPTIYPEEEEAYPEKLISLLARCVQHISLLPAFSHFTHSTRLVLNSTELSNLPPLLERCQSDKRIYESLRPQTVRKVHGDLYPENVLIHLPSLRRSQPRVMLLDPIAALGLNRGDFAMDVAKFKSWLSAELLVLRLGLFSIRQERGRAAFTLALHTDDPQLSALTDGALLRDFNSLFDSADWARTICDADPYWQQRVSFYEAIYALSMVPLVPYPQSLARFLVGVRHLHNFVCTVSDRQVLEQCVTRDLRREIRP